MANYARTGGKPGKPAYRTPSRIAHPFNRFPQPHFSKFSPTQNERQSRLTPFPRQNFFAQVKEAVKKIPKGKVATYGQIGKMIGTKDSRKVGWALHGNTDPKVPCHRVVNKDGRLAPSYAFGGFGEQKKRLVAEGVGFSGEQHVDLRKYQWTP